MGIQNQYESDHSSVLGGTVALREFTNPDEKQQQQQNCKNLGLTFLKYSSMLMLS